MIPCMQYEPKLYDDLQRGMAFSTGTRRVRREDIAAFAELSGDHTRLHSDDAYAASSPFGRIVSHGALNLAVATGLAYSLGIFEGTVLAVRSMEVSFDRPVFPEDELRLELSVVDLDERPRKDRGQVRFGVALRNQHDRLVLTGHWTVMLRRSLADAPA